MVTLTSIILATLLVSAISFTGGLLLFSKKLMTEKLAGILVSFAAGTLLAVTFIDLLPEALEAGMDGGIIFLPVLLGIVSFFFLERFVLWSHHHDHKCEPRTKPTAVLVLVGDSVHNFIDGAAIAAAFLASFPLGLATTLAMMAHEIPQEIADFSILIHGGMSKSRALFFNFLSGLTALLGAVASFYFLERIEGLLPLLLAFTGGMFIYIACADLIPELHHDFAKRRSWAQVIPFVLGLLLLAVLVRLLEG